MSREYEYNDEIECAQSGGTPIKSYKTKKEAKEACIKNTVRFFKSGYGYYWYDINDFFKGKTQDLLSEKGIQTDSLELDVFSQFTDDELKIIAQDIRNGYEPYYVVECE